jgi:hypothetical protein
MGRVAQVGSAFAKREPVAQIGTAFVGGVA